MKNSHRILFPFILLAAFAGCSKSGENHAPEENQPPQFDTAIIDSTAPASIPFLLHLKAIDPDDDPLHYEIINAPDWSSFNAEDGTLSGHPGTDNTGLYSDISVTVSDGEHQVTSTPFSIDVTLGTPPEPSVRFLTQASFGATTSSIEELEQIGLEAWIDNQLIKQPSYHLPVLQQYLGLSEEKPRHSDRIAVWWDLAVNAPDQFRQRIAYALSQIVVTSQQHPMLITSNRVEALTGYYDLLVEHAFGNYRDVLKAVTLSPIMSVYLSMRANQKANKEKNIFPDENYAREVMQLFSIGLYKLELNGQPIKDEQGNLIPAYEQHDVENLARVFTGWNLVDNKNWTSLQGNWLLPMTATENYHDQEEKKVLEELFPAGQSAEQDMEQAIDLLFNHANTAPFISKQLIQRLISSNPSQGYIERVAKIFNNNGYNIRGDLAAVTKAILLDHEARYNPIQHTGSSGKLKEPILAFAQLYRAFNAKPVSARFYDIGSSTYFGQAPLAAPSVFNFFSPNFAPVGEISNHDNVAPEFEIINPSRHALENNLYWYSLNKTDLHPNPKSTFTLLNFANEREMANDIPTLIEHLNTILLAGRMSEPLKNLLITHIQSIPDNNPAWRVREAVYFITASSEYQILE